MPKNAFRRVFSCCVLFLTLFMSFDVGALEEPPSNAGLPAPGPSEEAKAPRRLTLCAVGDNLIHSIVYKKFLRKDGTWDFSAIYAPVSGFIKSHDLCVINQETIFVDDPKRVSTYPCFGTPQSMGDALVGAGFNIVLSATNHTWDKQSYGADTTLAYWKEKHPHVVLLGLHESPEDRERIRVVEKNGIRLAMFNYTYGLNGFKLPEKHWFKVDLLDDRDRFLGDVRRAEQLADLTVCFLHIGEEYRYAPTDFQKKYVMDLANAGADLIICAHPHVVEPCEMLTAEDGHPCLVYYSCGNFVSGQNKADRCLGGLAHVEIVMEPGPDGACAARIARHDFLPTVTHRTPRTVEAYLLRDYTDSLARQHSVPGVSVRKMKDLWKKITGTEAH